MKSLNELYRIGLGPSSSHTMGPRFAALAFRDALDAAAVRVRVTLYGSLAATGRGHLTDRAVSEPFAPRPVELVWAPDQLLPRHPNALRFEAFDAQGRLSAQQVVYSVGGGALWGETLIELRRLSVDLSDLIDSLERNPQSILFGRKAPPPGPGEAGYPPSATVKP